MPDPTANPIAKGAKLLLPFVSIATVRTVRTRMHVRKVSSPMALPLEISGAFKVIVTFAGKVANP